MIRKGLLVGLLIVCFQSTVQAQGIMDSVFGPSGLGLWGANPADQWNQPQFYGGSQQGQYPGQEQPQQQYGYGQQPGYGQPQQGYAPPQGYNNPYGQPGVYSDWHTQPPAVVGPQGQAAYPPDGQQQYAAPPQHPQAQEYEAPRQQPARQPRRRQAAQRPTPAPPPVAAPSAAQGTLPPPPLQQPSRYSPDHEFMDADRLPAGAVQVTTTTREGTQVQYYPPAGMPPQEEVGGAMQPQSRPRATNRGPRRQQVRQQTAPAAGNTEAVDSIAMPKPVEIPRGHDPRTGWSSGRN